MEDVSSVPLNESDSPQDNKWNRRRGTLPKKLKHLWHFLTWPSRLYRRLEWWIILQFMRCQTVDPMRTTLQLHDKYQEQPELQLLYYFRDLAVTTKVEDRIQVNIKLVKQMIKAGADVHYCDDMGQNIMHEIARHHQGEICYFFLRCNVNINLEDSYCVTPLHVAAAFNNSAVVEILASYGGFLESRTFYMLQTPLHYAARYDSPASVKKLVEMGARLESRDYRGRTPLLLAAELGRMSAGAMLLDCGAKVYAMDFSGMYAISAMVDKCPPLALKALDTCTLKDSRNRKQHYSLQFLEPVTLCNDEHAETTLTVMEEMVRAGSSNLDIVKHSMIQKMIDVKWKQFGKRWFIKELATYIIVLINWSLLCIFNPVGIPRGEDGRDDERNLWYIVVANEVLAVLTYVYQVFDITRTMRTNTRRHEKFVEQRINQIDMEFKYLELLSKEEKEHLKKEREMVRKSKSTYAEDPWNTFDWFSLVLMFVTLTVHFLIKYYKPWQIYEVERAILLSITLVIVWLKMFKYCRVLQTLGPFCIIIASLPMDLVKVAIVYVILYTPLVCLFYHFFSGPYDIEIERDQWEIDPAYEDFDRDMYGSFEQTCFTVFVYTLVGDYGYETLKFLTYKRLMPHFFTFTKICIAYWIVVSAVLLLNIFIALMSETFENVYENAQVVSQFERAALIVSIENRLPSYWRRHHLTDISYNYAPTTEFYDNDDDIDNDVADDVGGEVEKVTEELTSLMTNALTKKDEVLIKFVKQKLQAQSELISAILKKTEGLKRTYERR